MAKTKEAREAEGQGLIGQPDLQRLATSLLLAFPDRASASWRDKDSAAADADGWNIFNAGELDARLERDNDASIFPGDGIVWLLAGVPLAFRALAHLLHWNACEFQQVIALHRWADTLERASTVYNLPVDATTAQSDCPRFTTRTDFAYEWNTVQSSFSVDPASDGRGWEIREPLGGVFAWRESFDGAVGVAVAAANGALDWGLRRSI